MQRLAACAGLEQTESEAASRAYLVTPTLVGREGALDRFRDKLLASRLSRGGALLIEGPAGVGPSRLPDACLLEAKTLGFTVMRATATGVRASFATARDLTEHLLETLPSQTLSAASPELFVQPSQPAQASELPASASRPQLRDFRDPAWDREQLQQASCRFWAGVGRSQPLVIAVDDVQRIDPASAAVLAYLLDTTRHGGIFLLHSAAMMWCYKPAFETASRVGLSPRDVRHARRGRRVRDAHARSD